MKDIIFFTLVCIMALQFTSTSGSPYGEDPRTHCAKCGGPYHRFTSPPYVPKVGRSLPSGVTGDVTKTITNGVQRQTEDLHKGSAAIFNTNEAPEGASVDSKIIA